MTGTDKQIRWATDIKDMVIDTWKEMQTQLIRDEKFDKNNEEHLKLAEKFDHNISALENLEYAHDIIDLFSNVDKTDSTLKRYKSIVLALTISANPKRDNFIK